MARARGDDVIQLYNIIPLALAIRRATCVASHTAHAEACLSARQNFLATEFPVTPAPATTDGAIEQAIQYSCMRRPRLPYKKNGSEGGAYVNTGSIDLFRSGRVL